MSFQSRLKEARDNKQMSRTELAKKLNISASSISNYENGISSPKEEIMYKIFDVLEVDPNFLFQDEYNPPKQVTNVPHTELEIQILEKCRKLNNEGQVRVFEYAEGLVAIGKHKKHPSDGMGSKQA